MGKKRIFFISPRSVQTSIQGPRNGKNSKGLRVMIRVPRIFSWLVICALLLPTLSCLTDYDLKENKQYALKICLWQLWLVSTLEKKCCELLVYAKKECEELVNPQALATKTNHFTDLYSVSYEAEGKVKGKKFPKTQMNLFLDNSAQLEAAGELTVDVQLSLTLLEYDNTIPKKKFRSIKCELFVVSGSGQKTRVGTGTAKFKKKNMDAAIRFEKVTVPVGSHLQGALSVKGGFVKDIPAIVNAVVWYQGIPNTEWVNIDNSWDHGEDFSPPQQTRQTNAVASTRRDYVMSSYHPGGKVKASKFPRILLAGIPITGSATRWDVAVRVLLIGNLFETPKKNEQFKSMVVMLYDVDSNGRSTKVGTASPKFDSEGGSAEATFLNVKKPKNHFEAEIQFKGGLVKNGVVLVLGDAEKAGGSKVWASSSSSPLSQILPKILEWDVNRSHHSITTGPNTMVEDVIIDDPSLLYPLINNGETWGRVDFTPWETGKTKITIKYMKKINDEWRPREEVYIIILKK